MMKNVKMSTEEQQARNKPKPASELSSAEIQENERIDKDVRYAKDSKNIDEFVKRLQNNIELGITANNER